MAVLQGLVPSPIPGDLPLGFEPVLYEVDCFCPCRASLSPASPCPAAHGPAPFIHCIASLRFALPGPALPCPAKPTSAPQRHSKPRIVYSLQYSAQPQRALPIHAPHGDANPCPAQQCYVYSLHWRTLPRSAWQNHANHCLAAPSVASPRKTMPLIARQSLDYIIAAPSPA